MQVECLDAADAGSWGAPREEHAFVVAMEVLDNMPHDRVCRDARSGAWLQTVVARDASATPGPTRRAHRASCMRRSPSDFDCFGIR